MKKDLLAHVIVSQGYHVHKGVSGGPRMQPWVENVNRFLRAEGYKVCVFACGENRVSFTRNNVETVVSKRLDILKDPFSFDIVIRAFVSKKPSVVIIHGLQHLLTFFSLIAYSLRRIPIVIIVHGLYLVDSKSLSLRDRLLRYLLNLFKGYVIIALTDYDRQVILNKWKLHPEIVKVTKVFLYLNRDELLEIKKVAERDSEYISHALQKTRFLYVGRLVHDQKRVDHLVKVFYRFLQTTRNKYPSVELILLGSGPLRETLENMVRNLALQDHVRIVGAVSDEEKWLYYLSSTAVVSMSEFEGLPRVIFEAFASGKIVIEPDICGLKEVVHEGINGFLFKSDGEFINILESLAANRHRLFIMQNAIREANVAKFEADANKEEMCVIIRQCAERHD